MSSRYTSSYSSRYGSGRDYGSSSYSSSRDRDSSSRDRDSSYTSRFSSKPKYSSYASKYSTDFGKSTDKMDYSDAPIAKDEIEELSYDAQTPTTPSEEIVAAPQEILQESQISDFVEEDDKASEVEEVKLTLAPEVDFDEEEEIRKAQELLASSTQIREPSPVASPVASPIASPMAPPAKVTFAPETFANESGNEAENRTPSPTVLNAKKLGGIPWPPKTSDVKKEAGEAEVLPKKRVSDLIARFNIGIVDESKKTDDSYKNEYGAGSNVGKVSTHNFA
ncbi:hypothetical protein CAEBREN_05810 [Caenorhabditis brenneri]|uniref:Uncharacterized protein n=1 Tax=Caenorhabditis brenneri TaxID=135651 RepID=G0MH22_CAEBE|nr:hypothetical protein CAEBREN_05810 [Caenorhabditis brenneri]